MRKENIVVVIPIFKITINPVEKISLTQDTKVLNEYDIVFVAPDGLYPNYFNELDECRIPIEYFNNSYFDNVAGEDKNALKKTGKKIFDSRLWQGTINASVYKDAILTKATSYENIVLYGAGVVGSKVKDDLVNGGVQKSRLTFAVTSKSDNQDEKDGIPVKQIDEFKGSRDNTIFIITVKEEKQYEMLQNLQRLGIENVLFLSDEVRYSVIQ